MVHSQNAHECVRILGERFIRVLPWCPQAGQTRGQESVPSLGCGARTKKSMKTLYQLTGKWQYLFLDQSSFEYPLRTSGTLCPCGAMELCGIGSSGVKTSGSLSMLMLSASGMEYGRSSRLLKCCCSAANVRRLSIGISDRLQLR